MRRWILIFLLATAVAFAFLVFVEGPTVTTEKVRNLSLEQDGFNLNITWDEMDCDGYDLLIMCDNKRTAVTIPDNEYTVHDIVLEKTYRVTVSARLKSGGNSRGANKEVTTSRLDQKLKLSTKSYAGFRKDKFRIKVKGVGDITFSSSNKSVAKVNDKGVVTLRKPGHQRDSR